MTGAKLAFERLTEEPKEQPKPETVKLYCVKGYNSTLYSTTKGKVYETTHAGRIIFDKNKEGYLNWRDSAFIRDGNLIPLVKRPAKVGEWVFFVKDLDGNSNVGCLHKHIRGGFFGGYACRDYNEYLVLDGYKGDPEAEKKAEELAKLQKQKAAIEAQIKALSD